MDFYVDLPNVGSIVIFAGIYSIPINR